MLDFCVLNENVFVIIHNSNLSVHEYKDNGMVDFRNAEERSLTKNET